MADFSTQLQEVIASPPVTSLIPNFFGVSVTGAVLFFTLMLIPFQQYSVAYDPHLFRYIRRDPVFIGGSFVVGVSTVAQLMLLFFAPSTAVNLWGAFFLFSLFGGAGTLWVRVTKFLNPSDILLPKIVKNFDRGIGRAIRKHEGVMKTETGSVRDC